MDWDLKLDREMYESTDPILSLSVEKAALPPRLVRATT
jgi:hypothetical protein